MAADKYAKLTRAELLTLVREWETKSPAESAAVQRITGKEIEDREQDVARGK